MQGAGDGVRFRGGQLLHQGAIAFKGAGPQSETANRAQTLAGIDPRLHGVRLLLGDPAVLQHLVDGLQLRSLQRIPGLGRVQVQNGRQLVDENLCVILRPARGWRRRGRGLDRHDSDDDRRQPGRR